MPNIPTPVSANPTKLFKSFSKIQYNNKKSSKNPLFKNWTYFLPLSKVAKVRNFDLGINQDVKTQWLILYINIVKNLIVI